MIITLSPSKGQDFELQPPTQQFSQARQLDQSQLLIDELKDYKPDQIKQLMSISDKLVQLNFDRVQDFKTPFTLTNAKQALFAFKGDVYSTIESDTYDQADLDYAQNHLRILSGLYGALRPLDLIQAYRLEMKTKLSNKRGEHLYAFWGDQITDKINEDMASQTEKTLVNLASNEYFKSLKPKLLDGKILSVNFREEKEGQTKIIAIYAKKARGLMANWLVKNKVDQSEAIKAFKVEGYRFNAGLSDDGQLTFVRPQPKPKS
ncbi:MAG: cytoplasmic iron level regulating protein YaaA (DUF328/UPF0246 family) [Saprospiraceae bacterium]|jgi:cytoplasmic iron level regulating protein YaaA (DUF328/UPF0246 family)